MAVTATGPDVTTNPESESRAECWAGVFRPDGASEYPEWATPDMYPRLWNVSARFFFRAVVRAQDPEPPEYVTVPMGSRDDPRLELAMANWNQMWEAAQFRRRVFDPDALPTRMSKVAERGDVNVVFIPRTRNRYHEYSALFHLLPRATAERYGLPLLMAGQWPFLTDLGGVDRFLPHDFQVRLSRAWAAEVWRYLVPGSALRGFSQSDPIRVLAHNLDFWVPAVTEVIQRVLKGMPEVDDDDGIVEEPALLSDGTPLDGAVIGNARVGTDLWRGEQDAAEAMASTVDEADSEGRLRGILEAVRSNRVEDDFSEYWTFQREDFERKLYRKRSKVKVCFVELTDTIPVQGPETEVIDRTVLADFLALLDVRERQIVVLVHSGITKLTDVASILGYSNHSAISKRMKKIRAEATRFFSEQ